MTRDQLSSFITRWGGSASLALLDPACNIFTHPSVEGAIGYLVRRKCMVAFGDPVCSTENLSPLTEAFHSFAQEKAHPVIYLTASKNFADWAMQHGCQSLFEVVEELVIDPSTYPKKGPLGRLLNKKFNHAQHAGVVIKEYTERNSALEKELLDVENLWLKGRKGPQIYMSKIDFFEEREGKRCFYAEQNGAVVGVLFLIKLEAQEGWLLYLVMTTPTAAGGTSESLIVSALDKLAEEGCRSFSFGISAAEEIGNIVGLHPFFAWGSRFIFKTVKKMFSLDNRRKFWEKFAPQKKPAYVLLSRPTIGLKELIAIMRTVNAGF